MGFWAAGLLTFFSNPEGTSEQIEKLISWLGDKTRNHKNERPCTTYETVAWRMMDTVEQYWQHSYEHGLGEPLKSTAQIASALRDGRLVELKPTKAYALDSMIYSFPVALPGTKELIDTLAERFRKELINTNLRGTRLRVTSVLRTESSVKELVRHNRNAIKNSAHLHGTTFDVSYASYNFTRPIDDQEAGYLREILARVLFRLRKEGRCWVTYELYQPCFHVVMRINEKA